MSAGVGGHDPAVSLEQARMLWWPCLFLIFWNHCLINHLDRFPRGYYYENVKLWDGKLLFRLFLFLYLWWALCIWSKVVCSIFPYVNIDALILNGFLMLHFLLLQLLRCLTIFMGLIIQSLGDSVHLFICTFRSSLCSFHDKWSFIDKKQNPQDSKSWVSLQESVLGA